MNALSMHQGKIIMFPDNDHKKSKSFRNNNGISDELLRKLLENGRNRGLEKIIPFPVEKIDMAEWVRLKCQFGCCQYDTNWCCPPASPDLVKTRAIIREYSLALLLVGSRQCKDFYLSNARRRAEQVRSWKEIVGIERQLFLEGYDKAISLVSGACALCKKCTYPRACRFPKERRPPIEAFSIDLIGTLKNLGLQTPVAQETYDIFRYYAIILLE
jgi:5-hydroxybenzimidazole methyltransferase